MIAAGSGNVFADLGYADAGERTLKVQLAIEVNRLLKGQATTQAQAAAALGILQPHVSDLARYRLDRFSVERLMSFLAALGQDVEIRIGARLARGSRPAVRVSRASSVTTVSAGRPAAAFKPLVLAKLASLCRKYHVRRLSVFGSAARGESTPRSDVDLLVEFEHGQAPSFRVEPELRAAFGALFGRTVDLVPPAVLENPYRRKSILRELKVLYEA